MVGSPVRFLFACYEELYMLTNHEVIYIYFIDYAIAQSVKLCHVFRDVIYLFIYLFMFSLYDRKGFAHAYVIHSKLHVA